MAKASAYVHLQYGLDARSYRKRYTDGKVPDATPYGLHHAQQMGFDVSFSTDTPESKFADFLRRALKRILGFDIIHAYRNRAKINASDVVWTMTEREYLAIAALPSIAWSVKRPCLIAQTVWLFNCWSDYSFPRRWIYERLLHRADVLTFHSEQYLQLVPRLVPGLKPHLLYFGISLDSFPLTEKGISRHTPLRILSMGNDPSRDWDTLLDAFGNDDRFALKVVCNWLSDDRVRGVRNLECPRSPTMPEYRSLYEWADVVVVTMNKNYYSGITVALEAASMGVPVVASHTGGVPTYFTSAEVLYVLPENPEALRNAVLSSSVEEWAERSRNARQRFLEEDYSSKGMAQRYVDLSEKLINKEGC